VLARQLKKQWSNFDDFFLRQQLQDVLSFGNNQDQHLGDRFFVKFSASDIIK